MLGWMDGVTASNVGGGEDGAGRGSQVQILWEGRDREGQGEEFKTCGVEGGRGSQLQILWEELIAPDDERGDGRIYHSTETLLVHSQSKQVDFSAGLNLTHMC